MVLTTRSGSSPGSVSNAVFETTRITSICGNSATRRDTRIHAVAMPAGQTTVTRTFGRRRWRSREPARYIVSSPTSSIGRSVPSTGPTSVRISSAAR